MKRLAFPSPVGILCAVEEEGYVTALHFGGKGRDETPLLRQTRRQLEEYFQGTRQEFELPLKPRGTPFQLRVWKALSEIPYGEMRSYGALLQDPKLARAVGMACHRNPLPILIPCHRVVGAGGQLTGYAYGLDIKHQLLALEQENI